MIILDCSKSNIFTLPILSIFRILTEEYLNVYWIQKLEYSHIFLCSLRLESCGQRIKSSTIIGRKYIYNKYSHLRSYYIRLNVYVSIDQMVRIFNNIYLDKNGERSALDQRKVVQRTKHLSTLNWFCWHITGWANQLRRILHYDEKWYNTASKTVLVPESVHISRKVFHSQTGILVIKLF